MIRTAFTWTGRLAVLLLLIAGVSVGMTSCASVNEPVAPAPSTAFRVSTLNVHYIRLGVETGDWSVGDWERRKGPLDEAFKSVDADIFAFQEMESFGRGDSDNVNLARDWLLEQNPGYAAGANGDSATFPSTQPIFYRTDRVRLVDQGWFFFSETPDVIYSRTFNGSYPAFASWAQFEIGGEALRVVNVHTDYASMENRRLSAALVRDRIAPWIEAGERVMVVGDLNARAGGTPQQLIGEAGVAWIDVPGATYHLNRGLNLFGAIDHVGISTGISQVGDTQVVRRQFSGEWPTDHYPVVADFAFE